jgi:hypothetical protein
VYTPTQAKIELGPLATAHDCEEALKLIASDPKGCLQAASNVVTRLLWSTYRRKRLEIAGLNMRTDDDAKIHITRTDYRKPYLRWFCPACACSWEPSFCLCIVWISSTSRLTGMIRGSSFPRTKYRD